MLQYLHMQLKEIRKQLAKYKELHEHCGINIKLHKNYVSTNTHGRNDDIPVNLKSCKIVN